MRNLISTLILSLIFLSPIFSQNYFGNNCKHGKCTATTQSFTECKNCVSKSGDLTCKTHSSTNYDSSTPSYSDPYNSSSATIKNKCSATTQTGYSCSNNAKSNSSYCGTHDRQDTQRMTPVNYCSALTKKGTQCRNKVKTGGMYCGRHD